MLYREKGLYQIGETAGVRSRKKVYSEEEQQDGLAEVATKMETAMRNVSINDRNTPVQPEPDPDQPLDFSSRKNVTPKDDEVLRKASKDSAISLSEDDRLSPRPLSPQNTQSPQNGSADTHRSSLIGDPRMALPLNFPMPPVSMAGMGMPLMLPPHAMFPQGLMPPGFGPMWPNQMAAMMQQDAARKALNAAKFPTNILNHANAQRIKPTNGTKDNPMNGNLSAAMRNLPSMLPGMPPSLFNNPIMTDPNIFAEAVKSHEDMFNMYKQQVLNQKAAEDAKRVPRKSSAPCTLTFSSSTPPVSRPNPASQSHTNDTKDQNGKVHEPMDIPYLQESENLLNGNNGAQFPRSSSVTQSSDEGKSSSTESISKHQNSDSSHSSTNQLHSHLPHLNEVACSSEGRRSLTPAYSLNDDVMRPRSSTLPCKPAVTSLSNSPTPSLLSSGTTTPNKGSFRKRARTLPDEQKDEAYWERRRKNNEAAKRSRDSRRAKEDDIAIRAAFLEQENIRLRVELASLRQQTAKLRSELIIYQTPEEMNAENLSVEQS